MTSLPARRRYIAVGKAPSTTAARSSPWMRSPTVVGPVATSWDLGTAPTRSADADFELGAAPQGVRHVADPFGLGSESLEQLTRDVGTDRGRDALELEPPIGADDTHVQFL